LTSFAFFFVAFRPALRLTCTLPAMLLLLLLLLRCYKLHLQQTRRENCRRRGGNCNKNAASLAVQAAAMYIYAQQLIQGYIRGMHKVLQAINACNAACACHACLAFPQLIQHLNVKCWL
jgi:hypothetical protein